VRKTILDNKSSADTQVMTKIPSGDSADKIITLQMKEMECNLSGHKLTDIICFSHLDESSSNNKSDNGKQEEFISS